MEQIKARTPFALLAAVLLAALLSLAACSSPSAASSDSSEPSELPPQSSEAAASYTTAVDDSDPYGAGTHHAVMTIEGYGPVTIELDADEAPVTVANFCKLADEGFYDGLNFYRFVDEFCMQGGSSNNSATPADDGLTPIVGEFALNGVDNALADDFKKGTVAMARSSNPNSADSTFFITLDTNSGVSQSLNGQYAAFGTIDADGMAVIDQVVADYLPNVTDVQMGSIDDESQQAKIESIRIVD